jgi:Glucokinase
MRRILAADIGGTNSRFGFFDLPEKGAPIHLATLRLPTAGAHSFSALLEAVFASDPPFGAPKCDMAVLAVPGPVVGGVFCHPPNIRWDIDLAHAVQLGIRRAVLINDFAAQAWACRSEIVQAAHVLQQGEADPEGVVAVIGAGTGLGHCALVTLPGGGWLALPSEAGHAAFPFVGEAESAYGENVQRDTGHPYCTGDDIVTGGGLARLFRYLTGQDKTPAAAAALLGAYPQVVEWFARFYGRACRNYALSVLAWGGVYVSGGVAAKNHVLVDHPAFLNEFCNSATHRHLLEKTPIRLNTAEDSGVFGAALQAAQMLRSAL